MIEQVLADLRGDAAVLDRKGHGDQARRDLDLVERIANAMPEYLTWLTEDIAVAYSDRSGEWLRARFEGWLARDLAKRDDRGRRYYRRCVLEHRGNADAAREAGRRAAEARS